MPTSLSMEAANPPLKAGTILPECPSIFVAIFNITSGSCFFSFKNNAAITPAKMQVAEDPKPLDSGIWASIVNFIPFMGKPSISQARFFAPNTIWLAISRSSPSSTSSSAGIISKLLYKLNAKPKVSYPQPRLADVAGILIFICFSPRKAIKFSHTFSVSTSSFQIPF